jgi:uncharacterized protein (DUF302 family)
VDFTITPFWEPATGFRQAPLAEDKIGTMLPCNVIVQEKVKGQVEVSAVDPAASMPESAVLGEIATEIRDKLQKSN